MRLRKTLSIRPIRQNPIETVVGVETTTLYEVEGDELKKCPTFLCLRVEGVNNNDYIKKLLNEYGYNFNDYSFI